MCGVGGGLGGWGKGKLEIGAEVRGGEGSGCYLYRAVPSAKPPAGLEPAALRLRVACSAN